MLRTGRRTVNEQTTCVRCILCRAIYITGQIKRRTEDDEDGDDKL